MLRVAHRLFKRVHETIFGLFLAAYIIPANPRVLVNRKRIILQSEVADDHRPAGVEHDSAAGFELAGKSPGKHRLSIALEIHQGHVALQRLRDKSDAARCGPLLNIHHAKRIAGQLEHVARLDRKPAHAKLHELASIDRNGKRSRFLFRRFQVANAVLHRGQTNPVTVLVAG